MRKSVTGDIYKGHWIDGRLENEGEYETSEGKYKGSFLKNREDGFGTKWFADGSMYRGAWKDGL